ncbi:hypothetical protein EB796_004611 [Bugula neritina]|uniref:Uncharacterized protein n=1 Tax=Bugula neritina TaxID=10212 RepID=A0A7J7KFS7_BUGNE|nr:hypothetical protein EB796_004611 [Bugula neritina]
MKQAVYSQALCSLFYSRIEESDKIWADIQLVDMADSIKAECVSPGLSNSPESNDIAEEDKAYDDIFNATANCFTDIRCPDIMADTESVLEPIKPIDQQMTLNKSGILSGTLDPSDSHNLDDLEAIFEKYDGSCLTSNGCFYDDLPDLTDDEDLSSRAPYIPLEINEDLEGLSPVDMKEFPVELQLKQDLANRAPYIPTIDLEELAMAESCCLDVDTESTLPSSSVGSNWTLNSSGHYRDQCHTDLSPDAPVSWQVDTSPGSTLSSVNSPTTSHDHLAAQVDSGQVYSPQEEISRCLDETLVVASEGSPVSSLLDENLFLAVNPQNVGESRMTHSAEVNGYKTATTFSPPDQRRYTHNQRKRKAGDLYTISCAILIAWWRK